MDQNENYQYKFQYSLANYHSLARESTEQDDDFCQKDEETILRRSNQLIDYRCFLNKDTEQIIRTLFIHYIQPYGRAAAHLFRICDKIYQNMQMSSSSFIRNYQEIIDHEREKLVQNLSELSKIFYNEKDKYFKLISLCVSGAIFKILTLEKQIEELQFETVFHTVYWEITGMHSTSQILKKLLGQTFNGINFHNYLINEEPAKVYKFKPITQSLVRNSTQFGFSKGAMNFSIKQNMMKSFNQVPRQKEEVAFSKLIKRKEKLSKQNTEINLKKSQLNFKPWQTNEQNHDELDHDQVYQLYEHKKNSNQKAFNFKKDKIGIFQNFSKSKSSKKLFSDFGSQNKKQPTFANYLQQKKRLF